MDPSHPLKRHTRNVLDEDSESSKRVTVRFPEKKLEEIDQEVEAGKYDNRSDAIRSKVGGPSAEA